MSPTALSAILSVLALSTNLASSTPFPQPDSTSIAPRGSDIQWLTGDIYTNKFGKDALCCTSDSNCHVGFGTAANGVKYQVCFDSGPEIFLQSDADALKCLTNLHYTGHHTCISIATSPCAAAYDGRIQQSMVGFPTTNGGPDNFISGEQSVAMQAGIQEAVGMSMAAGGPKAYVDDGTETWEYAMYTGENTC